MQNTFVLKLVSTFSWAVKRYKQTTHTFQTNGIDIKCDTAPTFYISILFQTRTNEYSKRPVAQP